MSSRTSPWPPGVPCWADLASSDVPAALAFYAAFLGWSYVDDDHGDRLVATVRGEPVAGIGPPHPDRSDRSDAWTLSFATDDADATAADVVRHGGAVLAGPEDLGSLGRRVLAADPTGVTFGAWQAGGRIGAAVTNEPGGLTWEDLRSPDPDAARAFYAAVFGHRAESLPGAPPDYTTFHRQGEDFPLGGMGGLMAVDGRVGQWLVYFGVADAATAVAAAEAGGGTVLLAEYGTQFGSMAAMADPTGAVFWVIDADPATQPDRSG